MKSVVVTGVSTGIGWGAAKVLIGHGFRVFGSVRKAADGERLSREFGSNVVPLIFDVTDEDAVVKAEEVDVTPYHNTRFAAPLDKVRTYMLGLGAKGLKPEVLGEAIHKALTTPKPKTRYVVTPDGFQNFMVNTLPKQRVDQIMGKQLGLLP